MSPNGLGGIFQLIDKFLQGIYPQSTLTYASSQYPPPIPLPILPSSPIHPTILHSNIPSSTSPPNTSPSSILLLLPSHSQYFQYPHPQLSPFNPYQSHLPLNTSHIHPNISLPNYTLITLTSTILPVSIPSNLSYYPLYHIFFPILFLQYPITSRSNKAHPKFISNPSIYLSLTYPISIH